MCHPVAPIPKGKKGEDEQLTICQLELVSSVISAVAGTYVREVLGLTSSDIKMLFYTDSKVTLFRIHKGPSDYYQWIANWLKLIQTKNQPDDWRWIPTDQNPADLGSRGVTLIYLNNSSLWLKGPEFLVDKHYDFDKYKK